RLSVSGQVLGDRLLREPGGELRGGNVLGQAVFHGVDDSSDDVAASPVADGQVHLHPLYLPGVVDRLGQGGGQGVGQNGGVAQVVHAPAPVLAQRVDDLLKCLEERFEFASAAFEIVRGQQP